MANISSYPISVPKGADLIVGSETYDSTDPTSPKGNPTRNFSVSSVVSTQIPTYIVGTINKVPIFTAANIIGDSIMTENAAGGSFTGKYISVTAAGGGLSTQNLEVNKALIDGAGSTGTDGFLLSSTTVGGDKEVAWINTSTFLSSYLPLAGGALTGNVTSTSSITLTGNITAAKGIFESSNNQISIVDSDDSQDFRVQVNTGVFSVRDHTNSQTIFKIDASAGSNALYLQSGGATFAGDIYLPANKGIYFGGNTTSAYELDNYQEGTFTPLLGGTWSSNPTNITGQFTRVGNKVTINIKWQGGSKADITTGYFKVLPTIPLAGELFVGSVSGANFLNFGVATISPDSTAADSAIYLSNNDFDTPAQNYFTTITYLMAT
jgi:hypothetical protein